MYGKTIGGQLIVVLPFPLYLKEIWENNFFEETIEIFREKCPVWLSSRTVGMATDLNVKNKHSIERFEISLE